MLLRGALVLTHFRPNDVEDTVDVDSGPAARPRLEIVHVVPPTTGSKSHSNNPQPGAYASLGSPWSYLTFNSMEKKKASAFRVPTSLPEPFWDRCCVGLTPHPQLTPPPFALDISAVATGSLMISSLPRHWPSSVPPA
jgi:hypothetical protein